MTVERDDNIAPYWMMDKELKRGGVDFLGAHEIQFFNELIEKYLRPIDKDEAKEVASSLSFLFFFCLKRRCLSWVSRNGPRTTCWSCATTPCRPSTSSTRSTSRPSSC